MDKKLNNFFNKVRKNKAFIYLVVILFFLFFSIINTYPLITHITTHELGDGGDGFWAVWGFWWMKKAIIDLHQNPFHTDYFFYPNGTDLYLHPIIPVTSLISIPLQYLSNGNLILTYNLIAIFNFVLAGFGMFILAYYFTKNKFASFIAGYIFAFSPYTMSHALGHLNLMSMGFIPFFIYYFVKFHEDSSLKNMIYSSLFLILTTFSEYYYGYFMFIFVFLYEIYYFYMRDFKVSKIFLLRLSLIFIIYFLVSSPIFLGIAKCLFSGGYSGNQDSDFWSPDVISFFVPGNILKFSLFFNGFDWWQKVVENSHMGAENNHFLGYTILLLILAGVYLIKNKKQDKKLFSEKYYFKFFLILGIIFFVFALGTKLKIFGYYFKNINLPYYYIYNTLHILYASGRFSVVIFLSLGILVSISINRISKLMCFKMKMIFYVIIFLLIILEFLVIPYPITHIETSDFYLQLGKDKGDFVIHDLSDREYGWYSAGTRHLYYQTIHNKKILTGVSARVNLLGRDYAYSDAPLQDLEVLGVKYVIVSIGDEKIKNILEEKNYPVVFEDNTIIVYQVYN